MNYIDPRQITTGDEHDDSRIDLKLIMEFDGTIETHIVPLTAALAFDNAYDHYSSCIGPLDDNAGVYYAR